MSKSAVSLREVISSQHQLLLLMQDLRQSLDNLLISQSTMSYNFEVLNGRFDRLEDRFDKLEASVDCLLGSDNYER